MWHLVLPSLTLGVVLSGIFVRLTRANMLDVLKSDYILAARARGIPERRVVYNHGLRNALIPIVTMLGLQFSLLLAGAILTESTFSWPGMGRLLLERIYLRDYPDDPGGHRRLHPLRERHVAPRGPPVRGHRPAGEILMSTSTRTPACRCGPLLPRRGDRLPLPLVLPDAQEVPHRVVDHDRRGRRHRLIVAMTVFPHVFTRYSPDRPGRRAAR